MFRYNNPEEYSSEYTSNYPEVNVNNLTMIYDKIVWQSTFEERLPQVNCKPYTPDPKR